MKSDYITSNLLHKINYMNEEFQKSVDIVEIQTTLKEISVDLNRIKSEISKINTLSFK